MRRRAGACEKRRSRSDVGAMFESAIERLVLFNCTLLAGMSKPGTAVAAVPRNPGVELANSGALNRLHNFPSLFRNPSIPLHLSTKFDSQHSTS